MWQPPFEGHASSKSWECGWFGFALGRRVRGTDDGMVPLLVVMGRWFINTDDCRLVVFYALASASVYGYGSLLDRPTSCRPSFAIENVIIMFIFPHRVALLAILVPIPIPWVGGNW